MSKTILITGGAGFIGINSAEYFLKQGHRVIIFDNFSRLGTEDNLNWFKSAYQNNYEIVKGDIRSDFQLLKDCVKKSDVILHLAGQVAVTTSVTNPREDFEINALGTFNVLEAMRETKFSGVLLFSSTNKVYGGMEETVVCEKNGRHEYQDLIGGVSEREPLDFHSPYGCSKGSADQYVRDYARIYDLKTIVFRQSCIYGYHQFGIEDQGWVAWFTIAALLNQPITIYGDGKQTRDVLFIDDLVQAFDLAVSTVDKTAGQVYNIGGGPTNQLSLLELLNALEKLLGRPIPYTFADWRPGDQKVFVCDIQKASQSFGWEPKTNVEQGLKKLSDWVLQNQEVLKKVMAQKLALGSMMVKSTK